MASDHHACTLELTELAAPTRDGDGSCCARWPQPCARRQRDAAVRLQGCHIAGCEHRGRAAVARWPAQAKRAGEAEGST
eukprot:scaffold33623_cov59-Phaeocystis_antarctica.AAC.2